MSGADERPSETPPRRQGAYHPASAGADIRRVPPLAIQQVASDLDIRRAQLQLEHEWQNFLTDEIKKLLAVFYPLNGAVFALIVIFWIFQNFAWVLVNFRATHAEPAIQPPWLVTERVLLALIAATAAQLCVLVVAIGRALFTQAPRANR